MALVQEEGQARDRGLCRWRAACASGAFTLSFTFTFLPAFPARLADYVPYRRQPIATGHVPVGADVVSRARAGRAYD